MGVLPCQIYLNKLHFADQPDTGLLVVQRKYSSDSISPKQRLDMDTANTIGASAVYFQRFESGREHQPQIYIFDQTQDILMDSDGLAGIHKKLWSGLIVPIYFVFNKTQFLVYNARKPLKIDKNGNTQEPEPIYARDLSNIQAAFEKYNEAVFRTGTFWEQNSKECDYNKTAGEALLNELIKLRNAILIKVEKHLHDNIKHLLMRGIFVKYLEERENHADALPNGFFKELGGGAFSDVVRREEENMQKAFKILNEQFNGDLFKGVSLEGMGRKEFDLFADFLEGRVSGGKQFVIWRQYDFNYIPVEVISRIYEEFMPHEKYVVYTPPHLANLIVDECLPLEASDKMVKLCDPSCGSGIFLVTAFRRLVQRHRLKKFEGVANTNSKIPELSASKAKKIMKECIHGMDISDMAVDIAIFSLSIALCDVLSSSTIRRREFQFDVLRGKNLVTKNFYQGHNPWQGYFHLVIGNPPFGPIPKKENRDVGNLPCREASLLFLQKSMHWLRAEGKAAIVLKAVPMLYSINKFQKEFHLNYTVRQVVDFSLLRNKKVLFNSMVSTIALFVDNKKPTENDITIRHIVVRRTSSAKARIAFEIDDYDFHGVPRHLAHDPHIWKSNLMGGWGVYSIVKRLDVFCTFGSFLKNKKESEWVSGEGYIEGGTKTAKHRANWLTGRKGIVYRKGQILSQMISDPVCLDKECFASPRPKTEKIFDSPHLLIRKKFPQTLSNLEMVLDKKSLVFNSDIIGIHAPEEEELKNVKSMLNKYTYIHRFFLAATSYRMGVGRSGTSVIQTSDIMSLPFPEKQSNMPTLSDSEKIIADDVLEHGIDMLENHENARAYSPVNKEEMNAYLDVFCRQINDAYQCKKGKIFHAAWVQSRSNAFVYAVIKYCNSGDKVLSKSEETALRQSDLSWAVERGQKSPDVHYKRVVRINWANTILFAKPVALRYWLSSIALRDAANVIADIERD